MKNFNEKFSLILKAQKAILFNLYFRLYYFNLIEAGLVVQSSTFMTKQHARHGFKPQIDRAAIRRTDYSAMEGNPKVTESQPHKWYRQDMTVNGC